MTSEYAIFPVGTLTVNLLGSFTLGFFITLTMIRWNIENNLRLAIATGFLGSFTTYSTFALETVNLFSRGHPAAALFYVALSFPGCFFLAYAGIRLAEVSAGGDERKDEES
jgi:CrcB protein